MCSLEKGCSLCGWSAAVQGACYPPTLDVRLRQLPGYVSTAKKRIGLLVGCTSAKYRTLNLEGNNSQKNALLYVVSSWKKQE